MIRAVAPHTGVTVAPMGDLVALTLAIAGWLAYGAALNEGRGLFASDELFGQWLVSTNLVHTNRREERAAAMWAAAMQEAEAHAHG